METLLQALLIFAMRVTDQTLGTVRLVMLVRGRRAIAGVLGFFESLIWVLAAAQVVQHLDSPVKVVAFAGGFAAGTVLGSTVERWIGMGKVLIRVVTQYGEPEPSIELREAGFGVSVVAAEGMEGPVAISFSVVPRRRLREALHIAKRVNRDAFVTVETTDTASLAAVRAPRVRK